MRTYIGGAAEPTFLSSGLEDYFVSSGYFHHRKLFQTPVSGLTHLDVARNRFTAYRFHDDDPVFFRDGLRLTLRCGEELAGRTTHAGTGRDVYVLHLGLSVVVNASGGLPR